MVMLEDSPDFSRTVQVMPARNYRALSVSLPSSSLPSHRRASSLPARPPAIDPREGNHPQLALAKTSTSTSIENSRAISLSPRPVLQTLHASDRVASDVQTSHQTDSKEDERTPSNFVSENLTGNSQADSSSHGQAHITAASTIAQQHWQDPPWGARPSSLLARDAEREHASANHHGQYEMASPPKSSHLPSPSPPRRNLRARKAAQLNPYTVEMATYKRRLERNDWEDAVVTDYRWRRRVREEQERATANDLPVAYKLDTSSDEHLTVSRRRWGARTRCTSFRKRSRDRKKPKIDEKYISEEHHDDVRPAQMTRHKAGLGSIPLERTSAGRNTQTQASINTPSPMNTRSTASSVLQDSQQCHGAHAAESSSSRSTTGSSVSDGSDEASRSPSRLRRRRVRLHVSSPSSRGCISEEAPSHRPAGVVVPLDEFETSSDESLNYDHYFKQLKRMMPLGMARKYIKDLKNMRKGKEYHSDGHESDTPELAENSSSEMTFRDPCEAPSSPPQSELVLQPGEARKRPATSDRVRDARFDLLGDSETSSDEQATPLTRADEEPYKESTADTQWWTQPGKKTRFRHSDDIDRMLSRSVWRGTANSRPRHLNNRKPSNEPPTFLARVSRSRKYRNTCESCIEETSSHKSRSVLAQSPAYRARPRPFRPHSGYVTPQLHPQGQAEREKLNLGGDGILFDVDLFPNISPTHSGSSNRRQDSGGTKSDFQDRSDDAMRRQHYKARSHIASLMSDRGGSFSSQLTILSPIAGEFAQGNARRQHNYSPVRLVPNVKRQGHGQPAPQSSNLYLTTTEHTAFPCVKDSIAVTTTATPSLTYTKRADTSRTQLEANAWADVVNLRLDFGIRPLPPGIQFTEQSGIGRGRLFALLQLARGDVIWRKGAQWQRATYLRALDFQLPPATNQEAVVEVLPIIFDVVYRELESVALSSSRDGRNGPPTPADGDLEQISQYLADSVTIIGTEQTPMLARHLVSALQSHLIRLFKRVQASGVKAVASQTANRRVSLILLRFAWFEVEILWRAMHCVMAENANQIGSSSDDEPLDEAFSDTCHKLMLSLLSYGLHHTMSVVKVACGRQGHEMGRTVSDAQIDDLPAEIWCSLIHLLEAFAAKTRPGVGFWSFFQAALSAWLEMLPIRRAILAAEAIWFSILSLCALSQFSASNGTTLSHCTLSQHWPLVADAFSAIRLRYEKEVERAMPASAIRRRDQYIRVKIQRCANLFTIWHWSAEGADVTMSKIFDIFNVHKLADLPSESDHDFPPFLRHLDVRLLYDDTRWEATAYHVFLKVLAIIGHWWQRKSSNGEDARRRISRLFSRVCPVRVMTFSRSHPPTAHERSSLFNHYSVAMLHLFLAPNVSSQRLRQIKSFLVFSDADAQSQITCIRAMMYAAIIYRHYELDLSPVVQWFAHVMRTITGECEAMYRLLQNRSEESPDRLKRLKVCQHLLVATLRSLQRVIVHHQFETAAQDSDVDLHPWAVLQYPDPQLLNTAWTVDLLTTETAVDPAIGMEVLRCLQEYLLQRNAAVVQATRLASEVASPHDDTGDLMRSGIAHSPPFCDSQNSFSEIFLNTEMGALISAAQTAGQEVLCRDRFLAEEMGSQLQPAIFTLLSNIFHPDRTLQGRRVVLGIFPDDYGTSVSASAGGRKQTELLLRKNIRRQYVEMLVDCWAGCAHVLVQNGMRDWASYLTYGNECWKRLIDCAGKQDVGLRFLQNVASLDGRQAYQSNSVEFLAVWFQGLAARSLSVQDQYTTMLVYIMGDTVPWFGGIFGGEAQCVESTGRSGSSCGQHHRVGLENFLLHRRKYLAKILAAMRRDYDNFDCNCGVGEDTATIMHRKVMMRSPRSSQFKRSEERTRRRGMIFTCLSSFLSAMRAQLEDLQTVLASSGWRSSRTDIQGDAFEAQDANAKEYLDFCLYALSCLNREGGEKILRGVGAEVRRTQGVLNLLVGEALS